MKHWARDLNLLIDKYFAEFKGISNLNVAEEEDSAEVLKLLEKGTKKQNM